MLCPGKSYPRDLEARHITFTVNPASGERQQ
jgi:hypothetical protein